MDNINKAAKIVVTDCGCKTSEKVVLLQILLHHLGQVCLRRLLTPMEPNY